MKDPCLLYRAVVAVGCCLLVFGCEHSPSIPSPSSQAPESAVETKGAPPELKVTVDKLARAVESFDIPQVLDVYANDFRSGTGRSKEDIRQVFSQLKTNGVTLKVERSDIVWVTATEAKIRTRLRLRYLDHFRNLGEGEVVVTDMLLHSLRKEAGGWKIYADERVSTYREGRFGSRSPNVKIEVPESLPQGVDYPVKVSVQREGDMHYEVLIGNYPEDPEFLPPPDITTQLPESGSLTATLLQNPQGRNEMVRITVIAEDAEGNWLGATTVSRFVHGTQHEKRNEEQEKPHAAEV